VNSVPKGWLANRKIRIYLLWMVTCLCILNMYYVGLQFSRHWRSMSSYSHYFAILFLLGYPIPLLHAFKKAPNPLLIVGLSYGLLSVAVWLLYPIPY
jgi:hypothetical protein